MEFETKNYNFHHGIKIAVGTTLCAFLALLSIEKGYAISQLLGHKNPKNTLSVSAEGRGNAVPDLATINLGVTTQGVSATQVEEESTKKINKIIEFTKNQGIDKKDITTTGFNISPRYDYQNGTNTIVGYQAYQTITIKVRGVDNSTEKLGKILAGATDNGANEIQGVSFSFDDPDNIRQQARKQAISKAKEKAQELAEEAGIRLGKVITVSESGGFPTPPIYAAGRGGGMELDMAKSVTPNIEPGSQDIEVIMTVVFEVK